MRADASRIARRYEVEQMLRTRGANLRTTRLQRNFSITEEGRAGIGVAMDLTGDAEHGKPPGRIAGCFGAWTFPIRCWFVDPTSGEVARNRLRPGRERAGGRKPLHYDP